MEWKIVDDAEPDPYIEAWLDYMSELGKIADTYAFYVGAATTEALMAEVYLDHPGDFHWFSGYGPRKVIGVCPHEDCPHNATSIVAWGPDAQRYELVDCDVDDGCAGSCRAWMNSRGVVNTQWLAVGDMVTANGNGKAHG